LRVENSKLSPIYCGLLLYFLLSTLYSQLSTLYSLFTGAWHLAITHFSDGIKELNELA